MDGEVPGGRPAGEMAVGVVLLLLGRVQDLGEVADIGEANRLRRQAIEGEAGGEILPVGMAVGIGIGIGIETEMVTG
jgi:hypothetical protein